jgi:TolB-like protein
MNMSGDPEQEYFADGMVEEIITALSRVRWLFVIARNSSFTYKGRAVDVKRVSRELGVRYVLEGSVRKAGQRVRITAQLIDARACAIAAQEGVCIDDDAYAEGVDERPDVHLIDHSEQRGHVRETARRSGPRRGAQRDHVSQPD